MTLNSSDLIEFEELVQDFIKGKFPQIKEDRQIENQINNTQTGDLKSYLGRG